MLRREMGIMKSIVRTLNFRRENFQLFKEIVRRSPWETVLRDRGTEQSWQVFKDVFQRAQELSVPKCKNSGRERKRLAWLRQEMLVKLRKKRELHRQWKQRLTSWEKYREAAWLCRDGVRKTKAQLEAELGKGFEK